MKVVVTGGIGSGKSTIVKRLLELLPEFKTISIDQIVSDLYEDQLICSILDQMLGTHDRKEVSKIVFKDQDKRKAVEQVFADMVNDTLHKAIIESDHIIVEFPVLFELGNSKDYDYVINVVADKDERLKRVMKRDGKKKTEVLRIMKAQATDSQRASIADISISNEVDRVGETKEAERTSSLIKQAATKVRTRMLKGSNLKVGIIAGSFDPITLGHTWIIKRSLALCDKVVIVLGHNPSKKFYFTDDEREKLVLASLVVELTKDEFDRVIIDQLPQDELLVSYADMIGAKFIFRGIRTFTDFEYENQFNLVQKKLAPHIDIVYLIPPRDLTEISSSLVKSVLMLKEWERVAADYVSPPVLAALKAKSNK